MKKILHINCSDSGSTGKIISDISDIAVKKDWQCVLCSPKKTREIKNVKTYITSFKFEQAINNRICWIYGLQYGLAPISTHKILKTIMCEEPDVVHLHSINCSMVNIYKLVTFLKKHKIPTVVTNHAEFFYTANCAYSYECENWKNGCGNCPNKVSKLNSKLFDRSHTSFLRMKKAFDGFEQSIIVSVSPWTYQNSIQSPIFKGQNQETILNGINTDVFKLQDASCLRKELGLSETTKIILHVTALFSNDPNNIKGSKYITKMANRLKGQDVTFIIAGRYKGELSNTGNMIFLGSVSDQIKLAQLYNLADLCVLTSKKETFSMPVAESLCCGTPIIGFKAGGPESIAIPEYTEFLEYGDIDALSKAIRDKWLTFKTPENTKEIAAEAVKRYDSSLMAQKYLEIYERLTKTHEENRNSNIS